MKIAVVTPSKPDRAGMLAECVASVKAQTRPADGHFIEVDVKAVGPSIIRNRLVKNLDPSFDWIAWLDDDDLFLPKHLEKLSAVAENADVVYSPSQHTGLNCRAYNYVELKKANYISVTCLVRRSMFELVGGFDDKFLEDWELWKKIAGAVGRFEFVPEQTWIYRIHGGHQFRDMKLGRRTR